MSGPVFIDTSAWFAFVNRGDPEHATIREVLANLEGQLVTSNYVFDETVTLCRYRLGHEPAVRVGRTLHNPRVVDLIRATADDEARAWELFRDRAHKTYSFTDCVSFSMMRRLSLTQAVALDEDFRREGFRLLPG